MTRILVIDDDLAHAELMRVVLEDAAFSVVTATGPADLPGDGFDCVVTDLVTAGVYSFDGALDWVRVLRERYPGVPILVTTAHPEAAADADRLEARVIVKPFDVDELADAVRAITS